MEFIFWFIIIAAFVFSLIGVIIPIIPDTLPLWLGVIIYNFFFTGAVELGTGFWIGLLLISLLIFTADFVSSAYFIKRQGGNRAQILTAFAGIIVGGVVLGPIGIIVGPLLGVFAVAWYQSRDYRSSLTAATSVILAFISSSIVKFLLQLVVIVWFFMEIF